ncbi:MAG: TonB-dependent receptor [Saprospiraceae bacterium]
MMEKFLLVVLLLSSMVSLNAQKQTVSGYVKDASNGETLIGATVFVEGTSVGAYTNEYGFYSLSLDAGVYTVQVSYIGFTDFSTQVDLSVTNQKIDFKLEESGAQIAEVVVTAEEEDRNVSDLQMSVEQLDMTTIQKLPTLLGETDVIRSIILLPGVTTVGEGAAGFNVRGGSIDQNLVILDEAPVYNSSHLFGFFSVFNPDAVKGVKLYKGGIPARFGGRLSSILDVRMREGNNKDFEMNGGIGTIFSRLSLEAPIVEDKASFLLAGRRSYIDVLAAPFLPESLGDTKLNFYDVTLKTNFKASEKDQFFLSGYLGRDVFQFGAEAGFNWGNGTGTFRWNHLFNERLFSNFTAYYSNYDYQLAFGDDDEDTFDWNARIINLGVKPEFSYYINPDNVLRFGGQSIYYEFQPANAQALNVGELIDFGLDKQFALESGVFLEQELKLFGRLKLNYGLRLSHFAYLGGRKVYSYGEADFIGGERPLTGITVAEKGEVIEDWFNLEPRMAAQYQLNPTTSLKASYNRTVQYIHLLSNTTASVPLDIWTPSTNNIDPQLADQVAIGYFRNFSNNKYELSVETYYKQFQNLVDYIDGADLLLNEFVESQVLAGEGRAYGAEFMFKKNKGRFNGWANYTLSRTERLVEGINSDEWYPSRFDQTHNLNLTGFYELNKRATLSATFSYNTGTPTTLPSSGFYQQGLFIPNNDGDARNNFRIPDYHRLDLSLTLERNPNKPKKRWEGEWVFGIYNLYGRRNAFSIYGTQQDERAIPGTLTDAEAIRFSVVGSVIPSISYNFKFK